MSKYAVNEEGVQALNSVAKSIIESTGIILDLANKLQNAYNENTDVLGPHKASLFSALEQIREEQKRLLIQL